MINYNEIETYKFRTYDEANDCRHDYYKWYDEWTIIETGTDKVGDYFRLVVKR